LRFRLVLLMARLRALFCLIWGRCHRLIYQGGEVRINTITESDFLKQVIDLAHIYGWKVAHFRPAMTARGWRTAVQADGAGFPDLVLVRDRVIFAELKSDGGKLSVSQDTWLYRLVEAAKNMMGLGVYVWRPSDFDGIVEVLKR
jgi:hypothetical protein